MADPRSAARRVAAGIGQKQPGVSRVVDVDISYRYKWLAIWRHGSDKALVDSRVTVTR